MMERVGKLCDTLKVFWSKTNRFHRVLLIFLMIELRILPGNKAGFECGDPSLSHAFTGDTISWKWLFTVCLLVPFVVMLLVERAYHNVDELRPKKRALRWYKEYLYGFLVNVTFVQLVKLVVGSPRPHFFDTCMPKEADTCQGSEYVSSYTCTKAHWLNQSDRSFPSGHTSLALNAGLFIIYYLHRRAPKSQVTLTTQAIVVVLSVACGLSRIWDRRHHLQDVAAGGLIASAIVPYTTHYLCKNFKCASQSDEVLNQNKDNDETTNTSDNLTKEDTYVRLTNPNS